MLIHVTNFNLYILNIKVLNVWIYVKMYISKCCKSTVHCQIMITNIIN